MYKSKTNACHFGTKTKHVKGHANQISRIQYLNGVQFSRCRECGSDYMRASIDGYCHPCLQLIEHRLCERLDVPAAITNGGLEPQDVRDANGVGVKKAEIIEGLLS
jgi:hypothetical protein